MVLICELYSNKHNARKTRNSIIECWTRWSAIILMCVVYVYVCFSCVGSMCMCVFSHVCGMCIWLCVFMCVCLGRPEVNAASTLIFEIDSLTDLELHNWLDSLTSNP